MKNYTSEELKNILDDHQKWLNAEEGGQRANLSEANLSEANLRFAKLSLANLSHARGIRFCSVCWPEHGECGRPLTAVNTGEGVRYFCGCFRGNEAELESYIANGADNLKRTRTLAFEFCRDRMREMLTSETMLSLEPGVKERMSK